MNRFQKLALATTIATFVLIAIGGFVRAAGAGLGCPDWPKCFGSWIPPTHPSQLPPHIDPDLFNFKLAWIEYTNRLVGVIIGLLISATAWLAWRDYRQTPAVLYSAVGAFLLVGFQGWFGGQVVKYELDPRFVTVHLVIALVIVGLLLWGTLHSFYPDAPPRESRPHNLRLFAWLAAVLSGAQIVAGALVRGSIDLVVAAQPSLARNLLIDQVGPLDHLHRIGGLLVLLCSSLVAWKGTALKETAPLVYLWALAPLGLSLIQFGAGVGLAYLALPPALQVVHIVFGSLLISSLIALIFVSARQTSLPPSP